MIGGVQEQVGQDLPVGTGIAVDHEALWHIERERDRRALEDRSQACDDLVSRLAKAERPSLGVRAVDRDLFERLDQLAGAVQVCYQLLGRVARGAHEFLQLRAAQCSVGFELGLEHLGAPCEARGHRQADADRVIDLMGDAGHQSAERSQPFGIDQVLLGGAELEQRALGLFLRGAQLVLGLALGDGVFPEHLDRPRHGADLVPRARSLHLAVVVTRGDRAHRRHDLLQRQPDRERDQNADGEDDAEEDHRDRQHPARDVAERPVERFLRLLFALPHLDRQIVDRADRLRLAGIDRIAQQISAA